LNEDAPLSFPDAPRAHLEDALRELMDRASEVMATQGRLRALLHATRAVVEPLELPVVLRRIIEAAVELVDAEYGALGVTSPQGGLEQFIHVGMPPDTVATVGHLPEGHGLLGALIEDPRPIMLHDLAEDPRSVGFPAGHPPMTSFLGVPIRVRGEVFGNLYLTNHRTDDFSDEDEQLVEALAATAGFAIENARLFAEARTRAGWMAASAELASLILATDQDSVLEVVADRLVHLAEVDRVVVVQPIPNTALLRVLIDWGPRSQPGEPGNEMERVELASARTIAGAVAESGRPLMRDHGFAADEVDALAVVEGERTGSMLAVPLRQPGAGGEVLVIARGPERPRFRTSDLEIADDLGSRLAIALELSEARVAQQRVALLEDRARIARDLHDHVIQQLFGTGLELQAAAGRLGEHPEAEAVQLAVRRLDDTIAQIRSLIFAITAPDRGRRTARIRIMELAAEASANLPRPVDVHFDGPVDLLVEGRLLEEAIAVVRELLMNGVRHAQADVLALAVSVDERAATISVHDDGRGIPAEGRRSGLSNLAARAERLGGEMSIDSQAGDTTVRWEVPLDGTPRDAKAVRG
jgi:signal transduction histidine kinase